MLLLCPAGARLAVQGETVTVLPSLGFDGYYRPGKWTPVFVDVSNQPSAQARLADLRDFQGQLMIETSPQAGTDRAVRFARPIDVPAASQKRYVVYARFPTGMGNPPLMTMNSARGRLLRAYNLHAAELEDHEILAVDISETAVRPNLPRLRGGLDRMIAGRLSPLALPEHWAGYDSADLIILPRWPGRGILPEALQAIRDHVQMGGTLVLLGGVEMPTYADPAARALLPVEPGPLLSLVEREGEFSIAGGMPETGGGERIFPLARVTPKPGAEVLVSVEGHPLLVREPFGNGQIVFFALDLRSSSGGLDRLLGPAWNGLLPERNLAQWEKERPEMMGRFQAISGRAAQPPNVALIVLICIVYTVVVGPVNFAVLIRRKRVEWAWFTLPAIVLVFFVLIYGLGRWTKEEQVAVRELRVETYPGGGSLGSFASHGTLFSSRSLNVAIRPGPREGITDMNRWWRIPDYRERTFIGALRDTGPMQQGRGSGAPPVLSYDTAGERIQSPSWPVGTFDVRAFLAEGPATQEGTISADLRFDGRTLTGTIRNDTPHGYRWAAIVAGRRHVPLGSIEAGGSRDIDGGLISGLPRFPRQQEEEGPAPDPLTAHNIGLVIGGMYSPDPTGAVLPPNPGGIAFVGLRDDDDTGQSPLEFSVVPDSMGRDIITIVHLDASPPPGGRFQVGGDALSHRLLRITRATDDTAGELFFDQSQRMLLRNARGIIAVDLPFRHGQAEVETFSIRPSASIRGNMELVVDVYNWRSASWERASHLAMAADGFALPGSGRIYFALEASQGNPDASVGWDAGATVSEIQITINGQSRAEQ